MRLGTSLRRRSRIEEELLLFPDFIHRDMTVPEDDQISVGKPTTQSTGPTFAGPTVVDHGNAYTAQVEIPALGQDPFEGVVVVAEDRVGHGRGLQLGERSPGRDVARMENDVGLGDGPDDLWVERVEPSGEMAVGEHDHLHRGFRPRPLRMNHAWRPRRRDVGATWW
jgi:hypothetical protein